MDLARLTFLIEESFGHRTEWTSRCKYQEGELYAMSLTSDDLRIIEMLEKRYEHDYNLNRRIHFKESKKMYTVTFL